MRGEDPLQAVHRIAKEEVGLKLGHVSFQGYYHEVFKKAELDMVNGIHTVSLVFYCCSIGDGVRLDDQSSEYNWAAALPAKFERNVRI